jgi:hypothetical protein
VSFNTEFDRKKEKPTADVPGFAPPILGTPLKQKQFLKKGVI